LLCICKLNHDSCSQCINFPLNFSFFGLKKIDTFINIRTNCYGKVPYGLLDNAQM